jgi:uncharacterized protein
MTTTTLTPARELIDKCLSLKRLALVGVSRDEKDFSRALYSDLLKRGYDVVPVNAFTKEIGGVPCYEKVQDIVPPVEWALLMTPPAFTYEVVRDCATAGIKLVWLHKGVGNGAVNPQAVEYCHNNGIEVVEGYCPYMFLPQSGFIHEVHGFFKKLGGSYPK